MSKKILLFIVLLFFLQNVFADTANCNLSVSRQRLGYNENAQVDVQCSSDVPLRIELESDAEGLCEVVRFPGTSCVAVFGNYSCEFIYPVNSPEDLVDYGYCSDTGAVTPRKVCFNANIYNGDTDEFITSIEGPCNYGFQGSYYVLEHPRIELENASGKQTGTQFNFLVSSAMYHGFRSLRAIEIDPDCDIVFTQCNFNNFNPVISIDRFALPNSNEIRDFVVPFTYTNESCVGSFCYVAIRVTDAQGNVRLGQLDGGVPVNDSGFDCASGTSCITSQNCAGVCAADNQTCNDIPEDNCPQIPGGCPDFDGDGYQASYCGGSDCDDSRDYINPGRLEVCGNAFDDNCNGLYNEGCENTITCEDPCTAIVDGVLCPGTCINNECLDVDDNCPNVAGLSIPPDGTPCAATDNGFSVAGTYLGGICIANISNPALPDNCSAQQLGEYKCFGPNLLQCQNPSAFDFFSSLISPLSEALKWSLVESCEAACIDSGANDYCQLNLAMNTSCVDSTNYVFENGASCKDKNNEFFDTCSPVKGNKAIKYRCSSSSNLCEPAEETCASGKVCNGAGTCTQMQCQQTIIGPNTELVCGYTFSGVNVTQTKLNPNIIGSICSQQAMEKLVEWVYSEKALWNQLNAGQYDNAMNRLFEETVQLHGLAQQNSLPVSDCSKNKFYSFDDLINGKADGKCVDWAGIMLAFARSLGVPESRVYVAGFMLEKEVRVFSPGVSHAALFYQSDSGEWKVFDLTGCVGAYASESDWKNACNISSCSLCRQNKTNDFGYSDFTQIDAGGACEFNYQSEALNVCNGNVCGEGVRAGECFDDGQPFYCDPQIGRTVNSALCGCPLGTIRDPTGTFCLCDVPGEQVGNTLAFCSTEKTSGQFNGKDLYYVWYDCAGTDKIAGTIDDIECGEGFECRQASDSFAFGHCIRKEQIV